MLSRIKLKNNSNNSKENGKKNGLPKIKKIENTGIFKILFGLLNSDFKIIAKQKK